MAILKAPKRSLFTPRTIFTSVVAGVLLLSAQAALANSSYDELDEYEQMVEIIKQGNLTHIKQLIAQGLDINQDIDNDGTPLIIAVQSGNKDVVEYMLSIGADVNRESERDGNPLVVAALTNNLELVKFLYSKGAVIDAVTEYDETALISASRQGHFEVVKYLVENGANVNLAVEAKALRGTELRSPLNGAKTEQIKNYLIAHGARS